MRNLLLMLALACGRSPAFVQQTAIGAPCDPKGTSEHPPDCAAPLLCTDAFGTGADICVEPASSGCGPQQSSYRAGSGLLICLNLCAAPSDCATGPCMDGVCVPEH